VEKIKVLVVDDSSLMRKLISNMVTHDPQIEVKDTASNGLIALQKIEKDTFDLILLDIEMPQMNGVEFLMKRKEKGIKIPVVVLSSLGRNRPELTLQCMDLGASNFIMKPSGTISLDIEKVKEEVIANIKHFAKSTKTSTKEAPQKTKVEEKPIQRTEKKYTPTKKELSEVIEKKLKKISRLEALAIGISTGGPNALRQILPKFPADFPMPILIVQHMPPGFTREFAKGLNEVCQMNVKEAEEGDVLSRGTVYIAPGDHHMIVNKSTQPYTISLNVDPPVHGHRPSAEVLFGNIADTFFNKSLCIIMTGMGKDGSRGIKKAWMKGSITMAQDEKTCVVFGMPKVAIEEGGIDEVIPLNEIPDRVFQIVSKLGK
jgi:two-component system, chemotaxis family, protein-glutamate methylesterase/glutaminase